MRDAARWLREARDTTVSAEANRLLTRVDRSLGAILRRAHRSVRTGKISAACGSAVRTAVGQRRVLVGKLKS